MCNKLIHAILPFIGFLCPLPSTAVHVIARGGRHTNGNGVYYPLLPTGSEEREVLGVGSIAVAILPSVKI